MFTAYSPFLLHFSPNKSILLDGKYIIECIVNKGNKTMADNTSLSAAKAAKNDEFYTQYSDIEAEMNAYVEYNPDVFRNKTILLPCDDPEWSSFTKYFAANFERFGLKKMISTSYSKGAGNRQLTFFEKESPLYDEKKHDTHGKLFVLSRDVNESGNIDSDDIEFTGYLEGDGDFRSDEVCRLRDEADIIITNPPFSLFREFLAWILDAKKQFVIIGSKNAITYKEVFPLLKNNNIWLGPGFSGGNAYFRITPEDARDFASGVYDETAGVVKFRNVGWFTNIDYNARHDVLQLDTMAHNLKYNKKLRKRLLEDGGKLEYPHYDNYDAIEVPFVECIPSDYTDVMGVPITFLDNFNAEQFEILGYTGGLGWNDQNDMKTSITYLDCKQHNPDGTITSGGKVNTGAALRYDTMPSQRYYTASNRKGYLLRTYGRILIRHKKGADE